MATKTESGVESGLIQTEELGSLQAILATQGQSVTHEEAEIIGRELLNFFEALGEDNESLEEVE